MDGTSAELMSAFQWPVTAGMQMRSNGSDVWAVISTPGHLERCHPFCAANPVTRWPGPDSRDEVHYYNGVVYERRFRDWIEGVGYDLEIGEPGRATSVVKWRLDPGGPAKLNIAVYPWLFQDTPLPVRWLPHAAYVRPMLKRYLTSVIRGVDWYAVTGTPVSRNQFGSHRWFSPGG